MSPGPSDRRRKGGGDKAPGRRVKHAKEKRRDDAERRGRQDERAGVGTGGRGGRKRRYEEEKWPRTWRSAYGVLTENAMPGIRVYGEKLFTHGDKELRTWNPRRSKLAALAMVGTNSLDLNGDERVLYLGASTGTTVSHLSDILADGTVFAIEKSPRSMRDLLDLARIRRNVYPILSDAEDTDGLAALVDDGVDLVYQDIAQRHQAEIFTKNCDRFLRPGGTGVLMIKSRSINIALEPTEIYDRVEASLRDAGYKVWERRNLEPFEKDHAALVVHRPA